MGKRIPAQRTGPQEIAIDGERVARLLGLEVDAFRTLMADRRITVLCERGVGEHAGLYRATFYHGDRRVRLLVDGDGGIVEDEGGIPAPR